MQNKFIYSLQRYTFFRFVIITISFIIIGTVLVYLRSLNKALPVIYSVIPKTFEKTDTIIIEGSYFGNEAENSFLKIDNLVIPSTLCKEWTNKKIVLSASMMGEGGLLFVIVKNSYSVPVFLPLKSDIPIVKVNESFSNPPSIDALSKNNGEVGQLIKIYGTNFGLIKEGSQVIFIRNNNAESLLFDLENDIENASYCYESNFEIDFWNDEEIHARIPDGAVSGLLAVKTKTGLSNTVPFNVNNNVGTKRKTNKKEFVITMKTELSHVKAQEKNSFFFIAPLPEETSNQSYLKAISIEPAPLVKNHKGMVIHQIDDIKEDQTIEIHHKYKITTYEINTTLNPKIITGKIDNKKLYDYYTNETPLIICKNEKIKNIADSIVGDEKNPYIKAKKIYDYIISNFTISRDSVSDISQELLYFLETKKGSPYDASILFASLCRALNLPTLVVAGIVVDKTKKSYTHWWNEFYIEGFGWVPLDIGMAVSVPFENEIQNKKVYYFGNIDSFRITFSHGEKEMLAMAANSKTSSRKRSFSLQAFWEETIGIEAYTCFWQVPQVISIN